MSNIIVPGKQSEETIPAVVLPLVGAQPFRLVDPKDIAEEKITPKAALIDAVFQMGDQTTVLLAGMYAIASDMYSRQPEGTRHAQEFFDGLGARFITAEGRAIDPAEELGKIK